MVKDHRHQLQNWRHSLIPALRNHHILEISSGNLSSRNGPRGVAFRDTDEVIAQPPFCVPAQGPPNSNTSPGIAQSHCSLKQSIMWDIQDVGHGSKHLLSHQQCEPMFVTRIRILSSPFSYKTCRSSSHLIEVLASGKVFGISVSLREIAFT